mmetsp:Transcript_6366/g.15298  ORF Transcript_6366/g.15298 Transcript_6366/m.15298 type:complete len:93 (-) Transcript_6366:28-306(-)
MPRSYLYISIYVYLLLVSSTITFLTITGTPTTPRSPRFCKRRTNCFVESELPGCIRTKRNFVRPRALGKVCHYHLYILNRSKHKTSYKESSH